MAEQETFFNESNIDLEELIELAKLFLPHAQKTMGFDEAPAVTFMSDEENSLNPLGKTAYYDPSEMIITVFVDGRHPKDILRSMSHELVHHAQNGRGMFDEIEAIEDGYAQSDDHLREMEREAYELGNMCFRDWEDEYKQKQEWHLVESARAKLQQEKFGDMMRRAGGAVKGAAMKIPGAEKVARGAQRAGQAARDAAGRADAMVGQHTTFQQETPEDFEARMKAASRQTVFSPGRGLHVTDDSGKSTHRFAKDAEGNQRVFGRDPGAAKQPHYEGDSPHHEFLPGSKGTTRDWHEWIYLHKDSQESLDKAFYTMLYSDSLTIDQKMVVYESFIRAYPYGDPPEATPEEAAAEVEVEDSTEDDENPFVFPSDEDSPAEDWTAVRNPVGAHTVDPAPSTMAPNAPKELSAAVPGARLKPRPPVAQQEQPPFPRLPPGAERLPRDARRANQRWYAKKGIEPDPKLVEETLSFSEELRIRSIVNESLKIVAENKRKQRNKININKKAKVIYEQVTEAGKKLTNEEIINLARLAGTTISERALYKPEKTNLFERDEKLINEDNWFTRNIVDPVADTASETWAARPAWAHDPFVGDTDIFETGTDWAELITFDADSPGASIRGGGPQMRYTPPAVTRRDRESDGTSPYEVQDPEQGWFAENIGEFQQQTFGDTFVNPWAWGDAAEADRRREAYALEMDMQSLMDGGASDAVIDEWISDQSTGDVQQFLTHRRYGVRPAGGYDPDWAWAGIDDITGPLHLRIGRESSSGLPDFTQAADYSAFEDLLSSPVADPIDWMAGRMDPKNRDAEHFERVEDLVEGYEDEIDAWTDPTHPNYAANSRYRNAGLQPSYVSFYQRRQQSGYGSQQSALQGAHERGLDYYDFDPDGCRRSANWDRLDNCIVKDFDYFYDNYSVAGESEEHNRALAQRMLVEYELDRAHFAAQVSVGRMSAAEQQLLNDRLQQFKYEDDRLNWQEYDDGQDWVWADRRGGTLVTRDLYEELAADIMERPEYAELGLEGSPRARIAQLLRDSDVRRRLGSRVRNLCTDSQHGVVTRCSEGGFLDNENPDVMRLPLGSAGASNGESFFRNKGFYKAHALPSFTRNQWTYGVMRYERMMQSVSPGYRSGMQLLDPNFVDRAGPSLWENAYRQPQDTLTRARLIDDPNYSGPYTPAGSAEVAPLASRQIGFFYGGDDWTTGWVPDGWHIGTQGDTVRGGLRGTALQRGVDLPGMETGRGEYEYIEGEQGYNVLGMADPGGGRYRRVIGWNNGTLGYGEVQPGVWGDGSNHIIGPQEGLYSRASGDWTGDDYELSDEQLRARSVNMQPGRAVDGIEFNVDLAGSEYPWAMEMMRRSTASWREPESVAEARETDERSGFDSELMPYLHVGATDAIFNTHVMEGGREYNPYVGTGITPELWGAIETSTPIGGRPIRSVSDYLEYMTEVDSTALFSLVATDSETARARILGEMASRPEGSLLRSTFAVGTQIGPDVDWIPIENERLDRFSQRIESQWSQAGSAEEWQQQIDEAARELFPEIDGYASLTAGQRRDVLDTLRINYSSNNERVRDMAQASQLWFNAMCRESGIPDLNACSPSTIFAQIDAMEIPADQEVAQYVRHAGNEIFDPRDALFFDNSPETEQARQDLYTRVPANPGQPNNVPSEWLTALHALATSSDPADRALRNKIEHVMRYDRTLGDPNRANSYGANYAAVAEASVLSQDPSGLLRATQQLTVNSPRFIEQMEDLDRVLVTAIQKQHFANRVYSELRQDPRYVEYERIIAQGADPSEIAAMRQDPTRGIRVLETAVCTMNRHAGCVASPYQTTNPENGEITEVDGWRPFSVEQDLLSADGWGRVTAAHADRANYFDGNQELVREYLRTAYDLYGSPAAMAIDAMMMSDDFSTRAGLLEGYGLSEQDPELRAMLQRMFPFGPPVPGATFGRAPVRMPIGARGPSIPAGSRVPGRVEPTPARTYGPEAGRVPGVGDPTIELPSFQNLSRTPSGGDFARWSSGYPLEVGPVQMTPQPRGPITGRGVQPLPPGQSLDVPLPAELPRSWQSIPAAPGLSPDYESAIDYGPVEPIPYGRQYLIDRTLNAPEAGRHYIQNDLLLSEYFGALSTLDPNGPRTFVIHDTGWQQNMPNEWDSASGEYGYADSTTSQGSLLQMVQTQASSPDHKEAYMSWLIGQPDIETGDSAFVYQGATFVGYGADGLSGTVGPSAGHQGMLGVRGADMNTRIDQLVSDGVLSEARGQELKEYRGRALQSTGWTHRNYRGIDDTGINPAFVLTGSEYMRAVRIYGDPIYAAQIDPDGSDGGRSPVVTWALKSENPEVFGTVLDNGSSPSGVLPEEMAAEGVYFSQDQWLQMMRARVAMNSLFQNRDLDGSLLWSSYASDPAYQGVLSRFHPDLFQTDMLNQRGSAPLCSDMPSWAPHDAVCSTGANEDIMAMLDARDAAMAPSVESPNILDMARSAPMGDSPDDPAQQMPDSAPTIPGRHTREDILQSLTQQDEQGRPTWASRIARSQTWYIPKPGGDYMRQGMREGGSVDASLDHLLTRTVFDGQSWLLQAVADDTGQNINALAVEADGGLSLTPAGRQALSEYLDQARQELFEAAETSLQERRIKKFIYDNIELIKERVYNNLDNAQVSNNNELVKNIVKNQIIKLLQE